MQDLKKDLMWLLAACALCITLGVGAGQWWRAERQSPVVEQLAPGGYRADRLVLFATSTCPVCSDARQWLQARGIDYIEQPIDSSDAALQLARELNIQVVPTFILGEERINGFARAELEARLATVGN